MKLYYLEVVSDDADGICRAYETTHDVSFSEPDEFLGGARTCVLADGSVVGVRAPMRHTESPVVRPYWLVSDIDEALANLAAQGASIAVPPMNIPNKGTCAIYILGANDHGLWQLPK